MRNENIKSIIIIALIVTFALSATYAYMNLTASNSNATGAGGCFEVYYSGQNIGETSSIQSTTNYLEGAHSQVILSKQSGCDIYTTADISIHTNETSTAPLGAALKYKVLNGSTTVSEGSITEELNASGQQIDNLLASVPLTTTQTTYDIYIWVDSSQSNGAYHAKTYSGYIYATSVQTSTIK